MDTISQIYIRSIIFGISDSLGSTVGILAGIDVSGTSRSTIILTGVVYAFVEAFSMAVGSFLSEESAEEFAAKSETFNNKPYIAAIVMFISFVLASFIPIVPYIIFNLSLALWVSIGLSVVALFIVGIILARLSKINIIKHGIKMMLLGGSAILIGVVVGKLSSRL